MALREPGTRRSVSWSLTSLSLHTSFSAVQLHHLHPLISSAVSCPAGFKKTLDSGCSGCERSLREDEGSGILVPSFPAGWEVSLEGPALFTHGVLGCIPSTLCPFPGAAAAESVRAACPSAGDGGDRVTALVTSPLGQAQGCLSGRVEPRVLQRQVDPVFSPGCTQGQVLGGVGGFQGCSS